MGNRKEKQKITLEALLELKRHERPGNEFWDSFESDFHRRRLHALCDQQGFRESMWRPSWKALVLGVPALMLMGLTVFWSRMEISSSEIRLAEAAPELQVAAAQEPSSDRQTRSEVMPVVSTNLAASQFVVDAIEDKSGPSMNFRKVLYTPAIHLSVPSGASYVRDNFSSSNYQVTTADLKLGRNF